MLIYNPLPDLDFIRVHGEASLGTGHFKSGDPTRSEEGDVSLVVSYDSYFYRKLVDGHWVDHRLDGPATVEPGFEAWYKEGQPHREGGPAVIVEGGTVKEWWENGVFIRAEAPEGYEGGGR